MLQYVSLHFVFAYLGLGAAIHNACVSTASFFSREQSFTRADCTILLGLHACTLSQLGSMCVANSLRSGPGFFPTWVLQLGYSCRHIMLVFAILCMCANRCALRVHAVELTMSAALFWCSLGGS